MANEQHTEAQEASGMKMAKASERDIDAAGNAMSVLQSVASGYYPARDEEDDAPTHFDPDDTNHLRRFYNEISDTLDASPGWPGRVIGGMCYVILYDKNKIVDPDADTLEIHPHFAAEVAALRASCDEMAGAVKALLGVTKLADSKHEDKWPSVSEYKAVRAAAREVLSSYEATKGKS